MPAPAGVLAPLLLAGVLLLSAVAKWRAPESTRSAIILLRLPRWLHGVWVAKALPVGEALLALAMLAPWLALARIASWAAVLLFLTYFVVIARAMTFSPRPTCGCFGKIGDQRVEPRLPQAAGRAVDQQRRADLHDDAAECVEVGRIGHVGPWGMAALMSVSAKSSPLYSSGALCALASA